MDVGEVHLETVLVVVGGKRHRGELRGRVQCGDCGGVEGEEAQRGGVGGVLGKGAAGEVVVVGRTEEENPFPGKIFFFKFSSLESYVSILKRTKEMNKNKPTLSINLAMRRPTPLWIRNMHIRRV